MFTSSKCIMDLEQHIPKPIRKRQTIIKKNETMAFSNEKEQLYLERCIWCWSRSNSSVIVGMWFPRNEAPDSAALQPITFMTKSQTNTETSYRKIKRKAIDIFYGLENSTTIASTMMSA